MAWKSPLWLPLFHPLHLSPSLDTACFTVLIYVLFIPTVTTKVQDTCRVVFFVFACNPPYNFPGPTT